MLKTLCRVLVRRLDYLRFPRPHTAREEYFRTVSNRRLIIILLLTVLFIVVAV